MNTSRELESGRLGLDRAVQFAHRHLSLDVAYVAELTGGRQVYRAVAGDAASFDIVLDDGPALEGTYCQRLVAGEIPNVIRDATAEELVADLPITREAGIGAYVGVPVRLSDGTLYGTLCCLGHLPDRTIDERATRLLSMLGELIVDDLDELRRRDDLRRELTEVIEKERVDVAYQPIFDPRSDRCLGIEALARFPEPFGRPDETFVAAESVGLGLELERLVVSRAWEMLPRLAAGQFLAVNVSPTTLLELARRANRREELPLAKVVVEVTEHSAVEAYAALRDELGPLRERGLRIAVDDAGAGYASLRHVLELRPDFIKLDTWLIHGLANDYARRVAVSAFVSLARELGAKVVAEGVERPADLAVIRDLGLDAAQGYLLGRPTTDQDLVSRWVGALKSSEAPPSARGASPASPGTTRRARR
jgi:EAL domain-containing protein (putative c-di-GMP-specific phosphodiesterase class I)